LCLCSAPPAPVPKKKIYFCQILPKSPPPKKREKWREGFPAPWLRRGSACRGGRRRRGAWWGCPAPPRAPRRAPDRATASSPRRLRRACSPPPSPPASRLCRGKEKEKKGLVLFSDPCAICRVHSFGVVWAWLAWGLCRLDLLGVVGVGVKTKKEAGER
jgi:hypothetical protein